MAELIEKKEDLGNAIALNATMFNGARFFGPLLAGFFIGIGGESLCFGVNSLSFIAVLASLFAIKVKKREGPEASSSLMHHFKEGFHYVFGSEPIRMILLIVSLTSLLGLPYLVLMPVFAKEILGGGPRTLGVLMSASGLGALAGALFLASRRTVRGLGKFISSGSLIFGAGLILFSRTHHLLLAVPLIAFAGFGVMIELASCNTVLQTIADDDKRGRVMSFYTMAFIGLAPFGSLLSGTLASHIGAPETVLTSGVLCLFGAVTFLFHRARFSAMVRPIYIKKGLITETLRSL